MDGLEWKVVTSRPMRLMRGFCQSLAGSWLLFASTLASWVGPCDVELLLHLNGVLEELSRLAENLIITKEQHLPIIKGEYNLIVFRLTSYWTLD